MLWHKIQGAGGTGSNGPTFVAANGATATGNPVTITTPTHSAGDVLLAWLGSRDNGGQTWSPPAGWTTLLNGVDGATDINTDAAIFYKVAGGSEAATLNFSMSSVKAPFGGLVMSFTSASSVTYNDEVAYGSNTTIDLSATVGAPAGSLPVSMATEYQANDLTTTITDGTSEATLLIRQTNGADFMLVGYSMDPSDTTADLQSAASDPSHASIANVYIEP